MKTQEKSRRLWNVFANTKMSNHSEQGWSYMTRCEYFYKVIEATSSFCYTDANGIPHVFPDKLLEVKNRIRSTLLIDIFFKKP